MTDPLTIFGLGTPSAKPSGIERLGYPRNPFALTDEDVLRPPFYSDHIERELRAIGEWTKGALSGQRLPLSIVGSIGVGKSRVLTMLRDALLTQALPGIVVDKIAITDGGYGKASLGALLVTSLERARVSGAEPPPDNVIGLVWSIVHAPRRVDGTTPLRQALAKAQTGIDGVGGRRMAAAISKWLTRSPLGPAEAAEVGLQRRIDWEGALIPVVADLVTCAREVGRLNTYFLLLDQLEDLFTGAFSELRRSRLLTDLRGLMDQIDQGMPMALVLTFGPEIQGQSTDAQIARSYAALASRIERKKVDLALFERQHAERFAQKYVERLAQDPLFNKSKQPSISDLVNEAWDRLKRTKSVAVTGKTTPRDLLRALENVVADRAAAHE